MTQIYFFANSVDVRYPNRPKDLIFQDLLVVKEKRKNIISYPYESGNIRKRKRPCL